MTTRFIGAVLFLAVGFLCGFRILHDDGIVGQTKKPLRAPVLAAKGCFCHGDSASPRTQVWVDGPETLAAGFQALYTINVAKDSSIAAGFDVAAFFGDLGVHDSTATQLMRIDPNNPVDSLELTHAMPKLARGRDTVSWSFWYRAPQTFGIIDTIYAAGNSVDTSGDPSGDYWNFSPDFLVHVVPPTGVREPVVSQSFLLMENYPNPFNPTTMIVYTTPVGTYSRMSLRVYDLRGREVATLADGYQQAGEHRVVWNAEGMPSGVYFYRLTTQTTTLIRKMLLLR